ncbi:MAG TPA: FtsQ-type POTRA domain-containing protein [Dehalococcoidia bacterium]|nr:FtsQ-type POTRA domain-containing protein [Dehalococcoidia bacterium]
MPASQRPRGGPSVLRQRPIRGHILLDDETQRKLRRRRLRRLALGMAVAAAVIGVVLLYRSPLLRVQDVQVTGTTNLDQAQLRELAGLDGATMFDPPLDRAEERIAALPLVKAVEAQRRWPHSVRIQVTERTPWGYWRVAGATYVIDSEGVVLADLQPPEGAPAIEDKGGAVQLKPGDRVDVDAVSLAQAMLARVPQTLGLNVSALEYTPEAGLALTTDGGYRVVLGDTQNVDFKLAVWQAVEADMGREAMAGHVLDLRFEDRPSLQ